MDKSQISNYRTKQDRFLTRAALSKTLGGLTEGELLICHKLERSSLNNCIWNSRRPSSQSVRITELQDDYVQSFTDEELKSSSPQKGKLQMLYENNKINQINKIICGKEKNCSIQPLSSIEVMTLYKMSQSKYHDVLKKKTEGVAKKIVETQQAPNKTKPRLPKSPTTRSASTGKKLQHISNLLTEDFSLYEGQTKKGESDLNLKLPKFKPRYTPSNLKTIIEQPDKERQQPSANRPSPVKKLRDVKEKVKITKSHTLRSHEELKLTDRRKSSLSQQAIRIPPPKARPHHVEVQTITDVAEAETNTTQVLGFNTFGPLASVSSSNASEVSSEVQTSVAALSERSLQTDKGVKDSYVSVDFPLPRYKYQPVMEQNMSTQMYEHLTNNDLFCIEWVNKNLFEVKLNPYTLIIDEKIRDLSEKPCLSSENEDTDLF